MVPYAGPVLDAAARIDEDVALGIDRDAGDFAEVHVVGQLQEIGHRVEGNGRRRSAKTAGETNASRATSHILMEILASNFLSVCLQPLR